MSGFIDMRGELQNDCALVSVHMTLDGKKLGSSPILVTLPQWDRLRDLSGRKDFGVLNVQAKRDET